MLPSLQLILNTIPEQFERLRRLQSEFAAACNHVAPLAQANRCWNRVALHHIAYREVRAKFPQLGSQMACNAIYSVARTYRVLLQHPQSPWNIELRPNQPLPLIRFEESAPVYFDRHTLSVKGGALSMYTLDGRLRFELNLSADDSLRFATQKLREIVLIRVGVNYVLQFWFDEKSTLPNAETDGDLPEYILVTPPEAVPLSVSSVGSASAVAPAEAVSP